MTERSLSIVSALPSGLLVKITGAALNFLAVPIALHALGERTYATLTAILGFAAWLAIGNAGIGNLTAMTVATQSREQRKSDNAFWQAVASSFLGVALVAALLIFPFSTFIANLMQNVTLHEHSILILSSGYCFVALALTSTCVAFEGRYIGLLRSDYCNIVRLTGQLLALLILVGVVPYFPNMLNVAIALTFGPLVSSLWFMLRGRLDFPPPPHFRYEWRTSAPLIFQGCFYLASSFAIIFYCGGNLPLFASFFGDGELTTAAVMAKIIQLYFSLTSIFVVPLAAALKQAVIANDLVWARKTVVQSAVAILAGSGATAFIIIVFGDRLIRIWTGFELPGIQSWIVPLGAMIVVTGWYHFWIYVCFAFEGAWPVAFCALSEVSMVAFIFFLAGSKLDPAASLWITAAAMLSISGFVLPIRVFKTLRPHRD